MKRRKKFSGERKLRQLDQPKARLPRLSARLFELVLLSHEAPWCLRRIKDKGSNGLGDGPTHEYSRAELEDSDGNEALCRIDGLA